jgi:hypothetical protein
MIISPNANARAEAYIQIVVNHKAYLVVEMLMILIIKVLTNPI